MLHPDRERPAALAQGATPYTARYSRQAAGSNAATWVRAGARVVRARGAHAAATAMCALLWAVLAVLQGTAGTDHGGSTRGAGQPLALTVATAVLVLVVSVVLWLAAFGTPAPAAGYVLTGLAVVVPLLLIIALRTGVWSRLGSEAAAGVSASLAVLAGAHQLSP